MWPTKDGSEPWCPVHSYWDQDSQALNLDVWVGFESWPWRSLGPPAQSNDASISERKGAALVGWQYSLITLRPSRGDPTGKMKSCFSQKCECGIHRLFNSCSSLPPTNCFLPRQWNPNFVSVQAATWFAKIGLSAVPEYEQWLVQVNHSTFTVLC